MTAREIEARLFEQLEYEVTEQRASAERLKERQRLDEVEHGYDEEIA